MDTLKLVNIRNADKRKFTKHERLETKKRLYSIGSISSVSTEDDPVVMREVKTADAALKARLAWEEKHMGNFERIYPLDESPQYERFLDTAGAVVYDSGAIRRKPNTRADPIFNDPQSRPGFARQTKASEVRSFKETIPVPPAQQKRSSPAPPPIYCRPRSSSDVGTGRSATPSITPRNAEQGAATSARCASVPPSRPLSATRATPRTISNLYWTSAQCRPPMTPPSIAYVPRPIMDMPPFIIYPTPTMAPASSTMAIIGLPFRS